MNWFKNLFKCNTCEALRENVATYVELIAAEKREKKELIELLLKKDQPPRIETTVGTQTPVGGRRGWYDIKRELELANQRKAFEENEQHNESLKNSVDELEKELIND